MRPPPAPRRRLQQPPPLRRVQVHVKNLHPDRVSVNATRLTFTSLNWNVAQLIGVRPGALCMNLAVARLDAACIRHPAALPMTRRSLPCRPSASEAGGGVWYPTAVERDAQQRPPDAQDKAHQVTDVASLFVAIAGGGLRWARSETKPAHPVAGAWSGRQGEARPRASLCPSRFPFATRTTSWYEIGQLQGVGWGAGLSLLTHALLRPHRNRCQTRPLRTT